MSRLFINNLFELTQHTDAYVGKTKDVLPVILWLPLCIALLGLRVMISGHRAFSLGH